MIYFNALKAEVILNIKEAFSYKIGIVSDILVLSILYFSLLFLGTGSSLVNTYGGKIEDSKTLLLIGYIFWNFSICAISSVSSEINSEATKGTLEQKFMSVVPIQFLLIGKFLSSILIELIVVMVIILLSFIFAGTKILINLNIIFSITLVLIGMLGLGLILGGVALREKRINNLVFIIQILLLFISDTMTKSSTSLQLYEINKLIPLTNGIDIARKSVTMINIKPSEWTMLIVSSVLWLFIGNIIFNKCINVTKHRGVLGDY